MSQPHHPFRVRRTRAGFSLIEMLVVVTIVGILLAISGGAIGRQIARDRVLRSATVVQGMLTEASQLAVRRRAPVRVEFNGGELQIIDRNTNTVIKGRSFGPTMDLRATLSLSPSGGITIFPNGRANSGIRISVSGPDLTTVVSRTATGIVRRE